MLESQVWIKPSWPYVSYGATDSGAYLIGMNFGKRRLAPRVSPNKSIEGAFGGILAAMLVTLIFMLVDSTVALLTAFTK